jgi:hypothetical protein
MSNPSPKAASGVSFDKTEARPPLEKLLLAAVALAALAGPAHADPVDEIVNVSMLI